MNHLLKLCIALCLVVSASITDAASGVVSEQIYFLEDNGRNALVYTTSRSDYSNYIMWFQTNQGLGIDDYIDNFLYMYPKEYTLDTHSKKDFTLLKFPGGSFAGLERIDLEPGLQVSDDGIFHFNNCREKVENPLGHYGVWNSPDNFSRIAYTWVFPANLEPVEYKANRAGEWVVRHNTITYYGSNVNDIEFDITYQPSSQKTYDSLKEKLSGEDVKITQDVSGVKISVAATVLFPTGIAQLSEQGKTLLSKVAETLKNRDDVKIIVEGHTDNVPISGKLSSRFPTNWELASIRSINVVHYLAEKGIDEAKLESRAFAYFRPIATNETAEGRAKNRRIEMLIEENVKMK